MRYDSAAYLHKEGEAEKELKCHRIDEVTLHGWSPLTVAPKTHLPGKAKDRHADRRDKLGARRRKYPKKLSCEDLTDKFMPTPPGHHPPLILGIPRLRSSKAHPKNFPKLMLLLGLRYRLRGLLLLLHILYRLTDAPTIAAIDLSVRLLPIKPEHEPQQQLKRQQRPPSMEDRPSSTVANQTLSIGLARLRSVQTFRTSELLLHCKLEEALTTSKDKADSTVFSLSLKTTRVSSQARVSGYDAAASVLANEQENMDIYLRYSYSFKLF
nr:hypothetical protein HmN_000895400 [Hymenolepis microstoma]